MHPALVLHDVCAVRMLITRRMLLRICTRMSQSKQLSQQLTHQMLPGQLLGLGQISSWGRAAMISCITGTRSHCCSAPG